MEDRAKYMPLIHQKYKTMRPSFPDLFRQIQEREKFYLDMIYTLMTKNKIAEERIVKAMNHIKNLEKELNLWKRLGIDQPLKMGKQEQKEESKEDTLRKYQSEELINTLKNQNQLESPSQKREIINTQTTIISPNSQQKTHKQEQQQLQQQNSPKSIDRKERRLVYLQDRPTTTYEVIPPKPQQQPKPTHSQNFSKQKQFKQQIIKNLIHQPIYSNKRNLTQPEAKSESDKRSVSQNSLNNSKTEGKLSYEKYLSQKSPPPVEPAGFSPIYNLRRRY